MDNLRPGAVAPGLRLYTKNGGTRMNQFTVSEMFSSHMVLSHDRKNPVWGTAPAGAEIEITLGGAQAFCTADEQGVWMAHVDTPAPGVVSTLTVRCGGETIAFDDVISGEVWLAGGQSNMEMPVMCVRDGAGLAEADVYPNVRMKTVSRRADSFRQYGWHFYPMDGSDSDWKLPDRESVACFSAIGYQFAALLSKSLNMPVGIIDCNWGGTRIQSWIPRSVLEQHEDTRADLANHEKLRLALGDGAQTRFDRFQSSIRDMNVDMADFITRSLAEPKHHCRFEPNLADNAPGGMGDPNRPGSLFEHMVSRVVPFGIKGVLWYQGESNAGVNEAHNYASLFERMRTSWQEAWNDPTLPFLTCQLATFRMPPTWGTADWNTLRLQQAECAKLPGVSMAILMDIGDRDDIHPLDKIPVAERLHALAMEDVYGIPCDAHEPAPVGCETEGNTVRIRFDLPIEMREGELPEILTADGPQSCEACIADDHTLVLTAQTKADAVQYAAAGWFVPSLFGKNGLPVAPFRMDTAE